LFGISAFGAVGLVLVFRFQRVSALSIVAAVLGLCVGALLPLVPSIRTAYLRNLRRSLTGEETQSETDGHSGTTMVVLGLTWTVAIIARTLGFRDYVLLVSFAGALLAGSGLVVGLQSRRCEDLVREEPDRSMHTDATVREE